MKRLVALSLALLAAIPALAEGKGVAVSLGVDRPRATAGELVKVTLRLRSEIPGQPITECNSMRIDAVAPGVSVRGALRSLEGGVTSRRINQWSAFRLASLRRVGDDLTWTARLRPGVVGRWTLVLPNLCALGYVLPEGWVRRTIIVTPR